MDELEVIEVFDPESGVWMRVARSNAMKVDHRTWELAVPKVDEHLRFRVNGSSASWRPKAGDNHVLVLRKVP
jgi:hypothetical protein